MLALRGAVSCFGGSAGCLGGPFGCSCPEEEYLQEQSPGTALAIGGSPGNWHQSMEGCLHHKTQDHGAVLAGYCVRTLGNFSILFRTPGTFPILFHNLQQQHLAKAERLAESLAACVSRVMKKSRAPVQYFQTSVSLGKAQPYIVITYGRN